MISNKQISTNFEHDTSFKLSTPSEVIILVQWHMYAQAMYIFIRIVIWNVQVYVTAL